MVLPEFHLEIADAHGVIAERGPVAGEMSDALAAADQLACELADRNRDNPNRPDSYTVKILDELRRAILTVVKKA